jgi:hypothetical protein
MRSNQAKKLSFAGLTIDGTGNSGTISSGVGTLMNTDGVRSTTNFNFQQSFNGAASDSTSSSSFVTVPGSTLDPFTLANETYMILALMGYGQNTNFINSGASSSAMELAIYDSLSATTIGNVIITGQAVTQPIIGPSGDLTGFNLNMYDQMVYRQAFLLVPAGAHTLSLQYRATDGGTALLDGWQISYSIYGN